MTAIRIGQRIKEVEHDATRNDDGNFRFWDIGVSNATR